MPSPLFIIFCVIDLCILSVVKWLTPGKYEVWTVWIAAILLVLSHLRDAGKHAGIATATKDMPSEPIHKVSDRRTGAEVAMLLFTPLIAWLLTR